MEKRINKQGRPTKINAFIEKAKDVLFRNDIVLLTNEELLFLINEELSEEEKVSTRSFERWKSGDFGKNTQVGNEFLALMKKALIIQKRNLFKKFENDDKAWTRWAWIIERKFSEWNLKKISETTTELKADVKTDIDYTKLDESTLRDIIEKLKPE